MIGIYDKWHQDNGNWMPPGWGGEEILPNPDDVGGAGAFWTIFLILFFLTLAGIFFKLYGR